MVGRLDRVECIGHQHCKMVLKPDTCNRAEQGYAIVWFLIKHLNIHYGLNSDVRSFLFLAEVVYRRIMMYRMSVMSFYRKVMKFVFVTFLAQQILRKVIVDLRPTTNGNRVKFESRQHIFQPCLDLDLQPFLYTRFCTFSLNEVV